MHNDRGDTAVFALAHAPQIPIHDVQLHALTVRQPKSLAMYCQHCNTCLHATVQIGIASSSCAKSQSAQNPDYVVYDTM